MSLSWVAIDFCSLLGAGPDAWPVAPGVTPVTTWGWGRGLVTAGVTGGWCLTWDISLMSEGSETRGEKDVDGDCIIRGLSSGSGFVTGSSGGTGTIGD